MPDDKQLRVYILASKGTLYTGVTRNLVQRVYQHKPHLVKSFTQKYSVCFLVYYEVHNSMLAAITKEKQIEKWKRQWKIELIENANNAWRDLYDALV